MWECVCVCEGYGLSVLFVQCNKVFFQVFFFFLPSFKGSNGFDIIEIPFFLESGQSQVIVGIELAFFNRLLYPMSHWFILNKPLLYSFLNQLYLNRFYSSKNLFVLQSIFQKHHSCWPIDIILLFLQLWYCLILYHNLLYVYSFVYACPLLKHNIKG